MRVFLTGGTGLIGRRLVRKLVDRGDTPVVLSRHADKARLNPSMAGAEIVQGDPGVAGAWDTALASCDAVMNLVGHNLFAERWNAEVKRKIRDSRVYGTEHVVEAIRRAPKPPSVLVQASAIGFYGPQHDEDLTEQSPPGSDFMAKVCREWEDAAHPAESAGTRLATIRTGVVLAKGEAALGVMTPIFKYLPGGAAPVGSGDKGMSPARGQQWFSWIHVDDIVGIFLLALDDPKATGPINGTAPKPERNVDFSRALSKVVTPPFFPFLPIGPPDVLLGLLLGEVAQVVTKGQKVLPAKAEALGYHFQYPDLLDALRQIFGKVSKGSPTPKPAVVASA